MLSEPLRKYDINECERMMRVNEKAGSSARVHPTEGCSMLKGVQDLGFRV